MPAKAGQVTVDLAVETASFKRDMDKAARNVKSAGAKMNRSIAGVSKAFRTMGAAVKVGVIGAAAMTATLVVMTKRAIEAADTIGKTADSIGISTKQLQEYRHAAELSGVGTANLDSAFQAFGKRMGELRAGTGTLTTLLDKMDASLKKDMLAAKTTGEALDMMFKKVAETGNAMDRAALASAAFGRQAGVNMTRLVKDGTAGLAGMRKEAGDLGLVIDESMIRQAEDANDQLTRMFSVIKVKLTSALVQLSPYIVQAGNLFAEMLPKIADLTEKFITSSRAILRWSGIIKGTRIEQVGDQILKVNTELNSLRFSGLQTTEKMRLMKDKAAALKAKLKELTVELKELKAGLNAPLPGQKPGLTKTRAVVPALTKPPPAGGAPKEVAEPAGFPGMRIDKESPFAAREGGILSDAGNAAILADERMKIFLETTRQVPRAMETINQAGQTFAQGFVSQFDLIADKGKTTASLIGESMGQAFASIGGDISRSLTDVVLYGKTWKDSLTEIGKSLIEKVVGGLIDVGVRMGINFAVGKAFSAAATAAAAAQGAATAAVWAPAATMVSLATFGQNALPAKAALVGTTMLSKALTPGYAQGGDPPVGRPFLVGEKGPEIMTTRRPSTVIPNHEIGSGGRNVNFYITTLDAAGFEEMLLANRGTIASIVNAGRNEIGEGALL